MEECDDTVQGPTDSFIERRRALSKNVTALRVPQRHYMPGSESLIDVIDPVLIADHPEHVELHFPSNLPPASRDVQCIDGLPQLEYRLRYAQATDALHNIRHFRRIIQTIIMKMRSHISNTQRTTTRSEGLFNKAKMKQARAVATYRSSWTAIVKLAPNEEFGPWKETLLELKDDDIRGPRREEFELSESRFVNSWIWRTAGRVSTPIEDPDLHATLRVEWCKAQERAKRYEEEEELVVEEMRRTLATFEWSARNWEAFATPPLSGDPAGGAPVTIGICAYAYKQAHIQRSMITTFLNDWYPVLEPPSLNPSWLQDYPRPTKTKRRRLFSNVILHHFPGSTSPTDGSDNDGESDASDGKDSHNASIET